MRPLRIAMLLYGGIEHDSRVRREMASLVAAGHSVTVATLASEERSPFELDGARIVPVTPRNRDLMPGDASPFRGQGNQGRLARLIARGRWAKGYYTTYRSWAKAVGRTLPAADVWHGHDLLGLLTARNLQKKYGGGLVHDSHELFVEAGSAARLPAPARALLRRFEGRATRKADAVITVNPSIALELKARYGVDPVVVMNCPPLSPERGRGKLRDHLGLGDRPLILYHGIISRGRGLEQLVDSIPSLPSNAAVVLLGYGDLAPSFAALSTQAGYAGHLYVVPAVPISELPEWICDADVGVIAFQPVDRNNVLGTPNKLFEYMESGVPMVVSDFPEMRRIVTETGAGIARDTSTATALAAAINEILEETEDARAARRRSARAAAESTYNWRVQSQKLLGIYADLHRRYGGNSRPADRSEDEATS